MYIQTGKEATLKKFSYVNKSGGTGFSHIIFFDDGTPVFNGVAKVKVIKVWEDYETGFRYWGEAISDDLKNYIDTNAHPDNKIVYFSEWEVEKVG